MLKAYINYFSSHFCSLSFREVLSNYFVKLVCTDRFGQEVVHTCGDCLPFETCLCVSCAATDVRCLMVAVALVEHDALVEYSADFYRHLRPIHLWHAVV